MNQTNHRLGTGRGDSKKAALVSYSRAINSLQCSLADPLYCLSPEVLCAVQVLGFVEVCSLFDPIRSDHCGDVANYGTKRCSMTVPGQIGALTYPDLHVFSAFGAQAESCQILSKAFFFLLVGPVVSPLPKPSKLQQSVSNHF